jgi:hypothetical protein
MLTRFRAKVIPTVEEAPTPSPTLSLQPESTPNLRVSDLTIDEDDPSYEQFRDLLEKFGKAQEVDSGLPLIDV